MSAARLGPWLAAFAALVGMLLLVLAIVYTFQQQQHVNQKLCEGTVDNRAAVRTTWEAARKIVLEGQETEEGRRSVNELFDGILEVIPPLHCVGSNPTPKEE